MPVNLSANMETIGNYDLVEKIAEGGMGTVYRGRNRDTGEIVAVKVVPQHLLSNAVVLKRFEQEYHVAKLIDHPNIVKALDYGREGNTRYLVMEFVDGESLGQKIERDGKMTEADSVRIISQVAQALQTAHKQGIIHRDVKPDNILITHDGQAKLTDLGLVKEVDADHNLTRTGRGLGTPHFMAPEQFRNAKNADVRCDIYSLGATLYMMVTGELPFKSNGPLDAWMKKINNEIDAPRKVYPDLSERIDWAIRRAMSPDPAHRPECCKEFVEDLTGQSTRPLSGASTGFDLNMDHWYLVYKDELGAVHTVRGTVKGIRRSLKENLLGDADQIRASRSKAGPFEALRQYPEFRDLIIQPEKAPTFKSKASDVALVNKQTPTKHPTSKPTPKPPTSTPPPTDSGVLATTTILGALAVANGEKKPGPCINLKDNSSNTLEMWKWIALGLIFTGGGILLAVSMPYLRTLRPF